MKFIKTDITATITSLRAKLYKKLVAPIDAMWEQLYIASAQNYTIEHNNEAIGYCSIDDNASLLQLYVGNTHYVLMDDIIEGLIEEHLITSASLSSSEPVVFNACLSKAKSTTVNTFCFEHTQKLNVVSKPLNIVLVNETDIPNIKVFLKEQVGMDDTFGYTENLVNRKELFVLKEGDTILATSECRLSDTQPHIADLGIIVNKKHQGKGIATKVMQMQTNRVLQLGRKPICSTTLDNVASRIAIEKSGFYCSNIILDISLK